MDCTWKDCENKAEHPQIGKNGNEWANLCTQHNTELDKAVDKMMPKPILKSWVQASGGAKKLAGTM